MTRIRARTRLLFLLGAGGLVAGALLAGLALAAPGDPPGPVAGLVSTTHPSETVWYDSVNPSFSWSPTAATGAAIAGYSYALDQSPSTVPDLSSERVSLDFLARAPYASGNGPSEVRVGDLNGDGRQDLVTADSSANTISVLLGRGDGTFNAKVAYAMNNQPWSMELGDLNRDGKLDVVTGDYGSNRASVRLGNGDGTFGARAAYVVGNQPECLRIGDLNHDGILDIVTTNAGANNISVLLGRGDGTFGGKVDYATSVHPTSIDLGDLNGDGNADLIAANTGPSTVSVLLGRGDGSFNAKVDYATGATPYTVIVADVNRDNKLDVATVNFGANSASILIGNGNGTLKVKVDYPVGAGPYALDVRDLNQDGAPDLVTTNNGAGTASVLMGNGDGTFNAKTDYATGAGPFWVTLGDFNGDGYGDLVTTDYTANTVSVRLSTAYLSVGFSGKTDGVWYFHVRAIDSLGQGGTTSHRTVRIDTTAPTTTQTGADGDWHNADVTMALTASDAASGVAGTEYRVDGGGWSSGVSVTVPAPSDGSNDGVHTIEYRSTDVAGNVETARSQAVKIVTSAPTTSVSGADASWHDSDVALSFSSSSLGVTKTEYSVDGGAWVEGASITIPASADGSNDGAHTVDYRSSNGAGYVEAARSVTVKIDAGAPTTSVSGADGAWHNGDVTLGLSGSDAGAGVSTTEYRVDGGAWVEGTSLTIAARADGSNDGARTVEYRSTDAAGHVEAARATTVKIDAGAPATSVSGADDAWHDADVTLSFTADDGFSGVSGTQYQLDGGGWVDGTGVTVAAPADGSNDGVHTVEYRSTDVAGNTEIAKTCRVKIVTQAPSTSVTGADTAWHASEVSLSFAASGAGVAKTECAVDGGAWIEGDALVLPAPPDGSNDGSHTVEYRSTNALGVTGPAGSCTVLIDAGAPLTTVSGSDDLWHEVDVTLMLSATDANSGLQSTEYRIDGGAWTAGTTIVVPAPADGSNDAAHTVEYRSVDAAGNLEDAHSVTVGIGRVTAKLRRVAHKLDWVSLAWPQVSAAAGYDVLVDGEVVTSTTGLIWSGTGFELGQPGAVVQIDVVARDGGGAVMQQWTLQRTLP